MSSLQPSLNMTAPEKDTESMLLALSLELKEKSILLALGNHFATVRNRLDLHTTTNEKLQAILPVNNIITGTICNDGKHYRIFFPDPVVTGKNRSGSTSICMEEMPLQDIIPAKWLLSGQPVVLDMNELIRKPQVPRYLRANYDRGMMEAVFLLPAQCTPQAGLLVLFSKSRNWLQAKHVNLIQGISSLLSTAFANIAAYEKIEQQMLEISDFKQQLQSENLYLQEEIQTNHNYSEMVGSSPVMKKVFQSVFQVAKTTSTVLILGETGTGKELIARALHNTSLRKDKVMVKVNCATLPANLIESELFGHEKGAFTGAIERRIGKFELANKSTLFLDEVGELPLDLQAKLLRALEEKEIERIGGKGIIKIDVRIIAATNANLQKEVQAGHFRSDLYFRLNVFPIRIAPLRERKEDIPVLATHFLQKHAKKGTKHAMSFSVRAMKELMAYNWPGNVRELEHLIERSILLTTGTTINQVHLHSAEKEDIKQVLPDAHVKTIDEIEREHIIAVLKKCNGKVAGIGGAAQLLQIPSTTLNSKIKRLKIKKGYKPD